MFGVSIICSLNQWINIWILYTIKRDQTRFPFITYIILDSRLRSHQSFTEGKKNGIYKRHKVRKNSYFDPFTFCGWCPFILWWFKVRKNSYFDPFTFRGWCSLLCDGLRRDASKLKAILNLYYTTTYMMVDMKKYSVSFNDMEKDQINSIRHLFLYKFLLMI